MPVKRVVVRAGRGRVTKTQRQVSRRKPKHSTKKEETPANFDNPSEVSQSGTVARIDAEDIPTATILSAIRNENELDTISRPYGKIDNHELNLCRNAFKAFDQGDEVALQAAMECQPLFKKHPLFLCLLIVKSIKANQADMFAFCEGAAQAIGVDTDELLRDVTRHDQRFLKSLVEINYKRIGKSAPAMRSFLTKTLKDHDGEDLEYLEWLLDYGGRPTESVWKEIAARPPSEETIDFLLDYEPKTILTMGFLQRAAGAGNVALVRKLVDAGADVNQVPPCVPAVDIRERPYPFRALYEIADRDYLQPGHLDAARVLLEHGADVNMLASFNFKSEILKKAHYRGNATLIALLEAYKDDPNNQHKHKFDWDTSSCYMCGKKRSEL